MAKIPAKKTASSKKTSAAKKTTPRKSTAKKTTTPKPAAKKTTAKKSPAVRSAKKIDEGLLLAFTVAQGMYEKKAEDIRVLDMRMIPGASADFFVISHGSNDKQTEAIARSAEEEVTKQLKQHVWHREGYENCEWVLLDYIDVVAHIFQKEKRDFYAVEELWGDAEVVPFKGK